MLSFFDSRTRQVQEMNLTQRREGARTQRVFANKSLRPRVFAALRFFWAFRSQVTAGSKQWNDLPRRPKVSRHRLIDGP